MKAFKTGMLLFLTGCLLLASACGQTASQETENNTASVAETAEETLPETSGIEIPENKTYPDGTADIHVTIESVEVSLADLKTNDYVVPVYVTLDQNSGINYAEWGAFYDSRCTVEQVPFDNDVIFDTVCSVNTEKHFFWTAWATANDNPQTGNLVRLDVTLPQDAKAGDTFDITYSPVSMADRPHIWNNSENDWVADGVVGWTDGGITVTE
ncbi:MAG: hypothetical protein E7496_01870 [Ruminococcus sp.]|nr:hypothetical protein [Ruminococcus sp.]